MFRLAAQERMHASVLEADGWARLEAGFAGE